jgi:hypothetical protein
MQLTTLVALCALLMMVHTQNPSALLTSDGTNIYRISTYPEGSVSVFDLATLTLKSYQSLSLPIVEGYRELIMDPSGTFMYYTSFNKTTILVQVNLNTYQIRTTFISGIIGRFADESYVYLEDINCNITRFSHSDLGYSGSVQLQEEEPFAGYLFVSYSALAEKAFFSDFKTVCTLDTNTFTFTSCFHSNSTQYFFGASIDGSRVFGESGVQPGMSFNVFDATTGTILANAKVGEQYKDVLGSVPNFGVFVDSVTDTLYVDSSFEKGDWGSGDATLVEKLIGPNVLSQSLSYGNVTLPDSTIQLDSCPIMQNSGFQAANGYVYYEALITGDDVCNTLRHNLYSCSSNTGICNSINLDTITPLTQGSTPTQAISSDSTSAFTPTTTKAQISLSTTAVPGQDQYGNNNAKATSSSSVQVVGVSAIALVIALAATLY